MHSLINGNFKLLKQVRQYVKGTQHLGLYLHSNSTLNLYRYVDFDWAGCSETRRSTTGFCTFLESNIISWSAKREVKVSRLSMEVENRALASVMADLTWSLLYWEIWVFYSVVRFCFIEITTWPFHWQCSSRKEKAHGDWFSFCSRESSFQVTWSLVCSLYSSNCWHIYKSFTMQTFTMLWSS